MNSTATVLIGSENCFQGCRLYVNPNTAFATAIEVYESGGKIFAEILPIINMGTGGVMLVNPFKNSTSFARDTLYDRQDEDGYFLRYQVVNTTIFEHFSSLQTSSNACHVAVICVSNLLRFEGMTTVTVIGLTRLELTQSCAMNGIYFHP